jgi:hypothetical protein
MRFLVIVKILNLIVFIFLASCGPSTFNVGGLSEAPITPVNLNQEIQYGDQLTTAQGWKVKAIFPVFQEKICQSDGRR